MATATGRALCFTCHKDKPTYRCGGCGNNFCMRHLQEHQQMLNGQLHEIINEHDQLKQIIIEQKENPQNSSLIKEIDQWEKTSIKTVRKTAQECREIITGHTTKVVDEIEEKLG